MDEIQGVLKKWLADLCGNDQKNEQKFRSLLLQDKSLVREINTAYRNQDILATKNLIENFANKNNLLLRNHPIVQEWKSYRSNLLNSLEEVEKGKSTEKLKDGKCIQCDNDLILVSYSAFYCKVCRRTYYKPYSLNQVLKELNDLFEGIDYFREDENYWYFFSGFEQMRVRKFDYSLWYKDITEGWLFQLDLFNADIGMSIDAIHDMDDGF
ncbi:hypothetical protein [Bacillus sp. 7884-1]|uniref:hypothetical protein n=1 Tax=Bacillus sp. 7884-1 TaxID=2021693 RepID=UPI000BA75AAF|nr:hypothetical protein [Bacillus sp. 7884-1]PAE32021.1 hypothetical protein CHI06_27155 [Bacillus sp. 7884-1]